MTAGTFHGQTILVTGAGGFIGSALVQALAQSSPRLLLLLDSCERNLFELNGRTAKNFPVPHQLILGSIDDAPLLTEIFSRHGPHYVFHAAAHKHVALLEFNPFAAVQTNALATNTLILEAIHHGCQNFVLLSTDKAVHPRSIMGATKRLAELLTVSRGLNTVRLGNVLGSTGSVVPIFTEQIGLGQPVTVTHPEATRYFISVEDAVAAILAAAHPTYNGKIFLPDLGTPIRIADLARTLIGNTNLPIEYVGLRPGEKLTEDLSSSNPSHLSSSEIETLLTQLSEAVRHRNLVALLKTISTLVPEYQPSQLLLQAACATTNSQ